MRSFMRVLMVLTGTGSLVLTFGFFTQATWATSLWPWPDGRLTFIFVSSIAAAIAVPNLWIAASDEVWAIGPGALNLAVAHLAMAAFLFRLFRERGARALLMTGIALGIAGVLELLAFAWSRRQPIRDTRPTPAPVRYSFLLFFATLILTGSALVAKAPHIFPWPLKPETAVMIAWIFWGASVYFMYGFVRPVWGNACGQLLGFLAYDLVLIYPYVAHFGKVKPEHRLSLQVYTGVLVYSGLLAIYYLFINPSTRFGGKRAPAARGVP